MKKSENQVSSQGLRQMVRRLPSRQQVRRNRLFGLRMFPYVDRSEATRILLTWSQRWSDRKIRRVEKELQDKQPVVAR